MAMPNLANDVYIITARPDQEEETLLGIQQALQIAHKAEDFPRDVTEIRLQANAEDYDIQAPISVALRKVLYIVPQYLQPDGRFVRGQSLRYVEPRAFNTGELVGKSTNLYYIAGNMLNIRVERPTQYFQFAYYAHAKVDADSIDKDWIVAGWREMIVTGAAAMVFKAIGNDAAGQYYMGLFGDMLARFKQDALYQGDVADMSFLDTGNDWGGQGGY